MPLIKKTELHVWNRFQKNFIVWLIPDSLSVDGAAYCYNDVIADL